MKCEYCGKEIVEKESHIILLHCKQCGAKVDLCYECGEKIYENDTIYCMVYEGEPILNRHLHIDCSMSPLISKAVVDKSGV